MIGDWPVRVGMLIAFLLPPAAVQVAAILRSPPRATIATPPPASSPTVSLEQRPVALTDAELAAAKHVLFLRQEPFPRSPMDHHISKTVVAPPVIDPELTRLVPLPSVRLQLIWASRGGDIAVIDGARYGEGDMIEGIPWIVREIDSDARSVLIEDLDGKQMVRLSIDKPPQPSTRAPAPPRSR